MAGLKKYNEKRHFDKTDEPEGKKTKKPTANITRRRFVVQHHLASRDHYDFRLEQDGVLLSWAVPKGPSFDPKDKRLAVQVEDHPLDYKDFEGTIPKGQYGGGTVMIWDEGYWTPQKNGAGSVEDGSMKFVLEGSRLKGKWALVYMKDKPENKDDNWLLVKENDEFAQDGPGISGYDTSIRTGRTMEEIEQGLSVPAGRGAAKNSPLWRGGREADGMVLLPNEREADETDKKKPPRPTGTPPQRGIKESMKNPFTKTGVQLAAPVISLPQSGKWVYELKYDGYRILAYAENGKVKLLSRNGNDYTGHFREVADAIIKLATGRPMVLDGEMVVTDDSGRADFSALQRYFKDPGDSRLQYVVFDLLALDGKDLREEPLLKRKAKLKELMKNAPDFLHYCEHSDKIDKDKFDSLCGMEYEGIIGKKADSVYSGSRNGDWIKLKCITRQEFVIGGYTLSGKKSSGVSSVLLGYYEDNELVYAGRAGSGLSEDIQKELLERFKKLTAKTSPFKAPLKPQKGETLFWLKPELAAEIKFAEWTADGLLRQASFKGLRTDKRADEVMKDIPAQDTPAPQDKKEGAHIKKQSKSAAVKQNDTILHGIEISSPQKLAFTRPQLTKLEVARYYNEVSGRMMPYIDSRIMSLICCPKGIAGSCHFKKHLLENAPGIEKVSVDGKSGTTDDYFCVTDVSGLVYLVQMNTIEFHTWGCRGDEPEKPDIMVFDLDPDEGMDIDGVRRGAADLKSILDELHLTSYLKTSGGKGYHIVLPLRATADWETFRLFAKNIAEIMAEKWPDRYTSNMRKEKRKGKIFIDWVRNGKGATSIAPYSLRAREGARISMPIIWDELYTIKPNDITVPLALERLGGKDPWADFFKRKEKQELKE